MKTTIIIQARTTSTRLPAKILKVVGGKTILDHVIERCQKSKRADEIVIASPDSPASAPIAKIASRHDICVYLGSEQDVLNRYRKAAEAVDASIIVRVTSDCPVIDAELIDRVIELRHRLGSAYASNVHPRSWPKGLDVEVFTMEALRRADKEAPQPFDREHVTPYIIAHYDRVNLAAPAFGLANHRWTLDYPEDLEFFEKVFDCGDPQGFQEMMQLVTLHDLNSVRKVSEDVR